MQGNENIEVLIKSIVEGNKDQAIESIKKVLQSGLDVKEILKEGIAKGAEEVGKLYEKSEIYLPELLLSADVMTASVELLKPHLQKSSSQKSLGTILIGTPEGDIHSIGKNIISSLLQGQGYNVVDLGTDVSPIKFVEKAKEINPDVIAMSGLLTATITKMQETVLLLGEENIKSKIIIGGGILSKQSCEMIGADDFAVDGWDGIRKIKKLLASKSSEG